MPEYYFWLAPSCVQHLLLFPGRPSMHPLPPCAPIVNAPHAQALDGRPLTPGLVRSWVLGYTRDLVFVNKPFGLMVQVRGMGALCGMP